MNSSWRVTKMQTGSKIVWDCRQARSQIALKAGGDLNNPVDETLLEEHLVECASCREYLASMEATLDLLQTCAHVSLPARRSASVWPEVAGRLPAGNGRSVYARFNVWVPTAAMTAACAAMILVTFVQLQRTAALDPFLSRHVESADADDPSRRDLFVNDVNFASRRRPSELESTRRSNQFPVIFRVDPSRRVDDVSPLGHWEW